MIRNFSEEEKIKYVNGFRNSHTPILEYCDKMKINFKDLNQWLREYKNLPKYGVIELKSNTSAKEKAPSIKFESNGIKIELTENYDKDLLAKMMEVIMS